MKPTVPAAGACAVTAYIHKRSDGKRWLYVANAGDSRAVLLRGSAAVRLSEEHKPSVKSEADRVKALGAFITEDVTCRINGMIGISRALGDHMMKELIISTPHIHITEITPDDRLLILACDGVWDVLTDQEAVDVIKSEPDAAAMSKRLLIEAIKRDSTDNISVIVIIL